MTTFKEAYCLMWYACKCGHRECIWNSRDGVTPFSVGCPSCNGMMQHVEWWRDTPAPEHELRPYQRYFRDGTSDDAERIMRRRIEMFPTGDPEYDRELIQHARNGDDVGEFRSGWPMLDIHLPHELQHSEPGQDHGQCPKCERPLETRTLILCPDCDVRITPSKAAAPEPGPENGD